MLKYLLLFSTVVVAVADIDVDLTNKQFFPRDQCTAIAVGPKAMRDGSVISTHNNDCQECDIRITHVPAMDWPEGSKRPIFKERTPYPRFLQSKKYNIHGPEYLIGSEDSSIYPWKAQDPIFFIDQAEHTYGYTMGAYPIQNEKQLSFGESTCMTTMWAIPSWQKDGQANFNVRSLMEVALERCADARCAIKLMGALAEEHGFYCYEGENAAKADCSEALTVTDPHEAWIFHITADDTHAGAVWVAQRVPDDHIAAIANQFIITEINLEDKDNFMASPNIFSVAKNSGLWDGKETFNYLKVYGASYGTSSHGITRRVWRVLTMADPDLELSPITDDYATYGYGADGKQAYPFSIKPKKPLDLQDIFSMTRDNYEGTAFDLTKGPDAGPWGDVIRSAPNSFQVDADGLQFDEYAGLEFPNRAISIWRTAYSAVTQSRAGYPDEVGAVAWIAPYAPHHSSFVPVYANAPAPPSTMTNTTQHKFDRGKNFWVHSVVGNYLSRWYRWTIDDVKDFQKIQERDIFAKQEEAEADAVKDFTKGSKSGHRKGIDILQTFQESTAKGLVGAWWDFFFEMCGKYRDIYKVTRPNSESFLQAADYIGYERWYAEMIGFWGAPGKASPKRAAPSGVSPMAFQGAASHEKFLEMYPDGTDSKYLLHPKFAGGEPAPLPVSPPAHDKTPDAPVPGSEPEPAPEASWDYSSTATYFGCGGVVLGMVLSAVGCSIWSKFSDQGYARIPDNGR